MTIVPHICSGCSTKYAFISMPFSSFAVFSHNGSFSGVIVIGFSRFCKKIISDVTSVPAFDLKAVFGSLTAPKKSAFLAINFLAVVSNLSRNQVAKRLPIP